MRCLLRFPRLTLLASLLVAFWSASCAGSSGSETGGIGTSGNANARLAIEMSQTYITIENRTGLALVDGQVEITPIGVLPPFKAALPRIENGQRRDVMLNSIRSIDGTPFRRGAIRARRIKITATDVNGKTHELEAPFQ